MVKLSFLRTGRVYPPVSSLVLICRVDTGAKVRPEGLSIIIPSGIESTTFRLVTQCLNELRNRLSRNVKVGGTLI